MKIIWHGHSCFKVISAEGSVVFDPYEDNRVPGYALLPRDLSADLVLCSHEHGDHNARDLVAASGNNFSGKITKLDTFHDDENGAARGTNIIHIIEADGLRLAHMGDIGCKITPEIQQALTGVDVILIPVGGFYTINAVEAKNIVDATNAKIIVPMHYRTETFGYDVIGTLDEFTKLYDEVTVYNENSIEVDANTPAQVAVLTYKG